MSSLRSNVTANLVGSAYQAFIGLIFVPLYINFMGIESWGLIGIFTTLQVVCGLVDLGISSTLNREMARLSALPNAALEMRNVVRTLETLYWVISMLIGCGVALSAPLIARYWIKEAQLSPEVVEQSLLIVGFVIAAQMPISFYSGGLMGLQKQVLLNVIHSAISTARGVGAVLTLWLVSPTVQAFFLWQCVISAVSILILALLLWRKLPLTTGKAEFEAKLLKGMWRFSAGISSTSILAVILTQLDKIVLSGILSLENFGYYTLASTVAAYLGRLAVPMFQSVYPRFTQLVTKSDEIGLEKLYHDACQFLTVLILPVAVVIAMFSYEILLLWTQSTIAAEKAHLILSILICGTALNGIMHFPYALQLANGWTSLSVYKTFIGVVLLTPFVIYMAEDFGAAGAASAWLVLNIGCLLFEIPIMHRRLMPEEKWRWYREVVCIPLAACILIAGLGRLFVGGSMSQLITLLCIMGVLGLTVSLAAISVPAPRAWLFDQARKFRLQGH